QGESVRLLLTKNDPVPTPACLAEAPHSSNVRPFFPKGVDSGAHYGILRATTETFSKTQKRHVILNSRPGIEPETPCPAVALATTRPTRQSNKSVKINNKVTYNVSQQKN
ncbi:hypothetical protein SFRURICE_004018, partial [Spodoptera frugiperda]